MKKNSKLRKVARSNRSLAKPGTVSLERDLQLRNSYTNKEPVNLKRDLQLRNSYVN